MSASAINAASPSPVGPLAGNAAGASAAQGPLAGFEALLAAFFGAQGGALLPGQAGGKTATTMAGAGGALVTDGVDDAADPTAIKTAEELAADAAAAATAQTAGNGVLVVPTATLPIADASAKTAAPAGGGAEAAKAAAAFALGKGAAKAAASTLPQDAKGAAIDTETAGAELDPNAPTSQATAKLDPSAATKLNTPEPPRAIAQPQTPAPPPVVAAPDTALDGAAQPAAQALAAQQAAVDAGARETAAPAAPATPKDRVQGVAKAGRNEHGRVDLAAAPLTKAGVATAPATSSGGAPNGATADAPVLQAAPADVQTEAADTPAASADAGAATASTTTPTTLVHPGAIPVRGSPQTVANLAAQIAKKLEGRSTRFDLQLDPAGLGRVDVRMEIGASGRMTAAMTFDTPQAAAELRSRAAELQRHLEQAGFDMSGGISFDVAGDRGQGRQAPQNQDHDTGHAFRGRAFQNALATAGQAEQSAASGALNLRRSLLSGVDIRI